jgi:hypothetical protein
MLYDTRSTTTRARVALGHLVEYSPVAPPVYIGEAGYNLYLVL